MSDLKHPLSCEQFELFVSDYIDAALTTSDRATMDAHLAQCPSCVALLSEVRAIVGDAAALPPLSPSRDLWTGIADRLDTPVVLIGSPTGVVVTRTRTVSLRLFAAAAVLLVSVSSGITYVAARGGSTTAAPGSNPATAPAPTVTPTIVAGAIAPTLPNLNTMPTRGSQTSPTPSGRSIVATSSPSDARSTARFAASVENSTNFAYEREITAMRRIVDERLSDLDSVTVVEIERNLRIIDRAINDSRRALQNDPRSRFLSTQLDRALENKLDIMRRIALL